VQHHDSDSAQREKLSVSAVVSATNVKLSRLR